MVLRSENHFTLAQVQDGQSCYPRITAVQLQHLMAQALPATRNLQDITSPTYQASGTVRGTYSKTYSWTFYCTAAKIYALEQLSCVTTQERQQGYTPRHAHLCS